MINNFVRFHRPLSSTITAIKPPHFTPPEITSQCVGRDATREKCPLDLCDPLTEHCRHTRNFGGLSRWRLATAMSPTMPRIVSIAGKAGWPSSRGNSASFWQAASTSSSLSFANLGEKSFKVKLSTVVERRVAISVRAVLIAGVVSVFGERLVERCEV